MPSSDSEDFESADEGHSSLDKKDRKKRNSSSNYSDNTLETEKDLANASSAALASDSILKLNKKLDETDGWDDFDLDDSEPVDITPSTDKIPTPIGRPKVKPASKVANSSQDTGWDDFGDWGNTDTTTNPDISKCWSPPDSDLKEVTDKLAATSTNVPSSSGWGWGWGVDSLLSTATAGITTFTNQVSQGLTTVLETGIGAPDPEELARKAAKEREDNPAKPEKLEENMEACTPDTKSSGDGPFAFGSILKFVGDTGTKVIAGGLDTLETIGRKTMEVLQDGDPHLAKKRALLGLDPNTPVLSQVLREAKAKAEEEDRIKEEKREAKEVHYENLFDDYEGLVHLEALEMISKQVNMRIEEQLRNAKPNEKSEMKETLQQVIELCEMPDEDEEEDEYDEEVQRLQKLPPPEAFHERLQRATRDLSIKLQFQPLVKQYQDIMDWISNPESELTIKSLNKRAISSLAQATALSVELYHKAATMLLVKTRRSTADEADAITQMTVVLTKHTSELANLFTEKLYKVATAENYDQAQTYITNIFLEAGNSSSYIHSAFLLTQPILQIGSI